MSDAEIQRRIQAAVDKAVTASHEQEMVKVRELMGDLEQKRQELKEAMADLDVSQRRWENARLVAYDRAQSIPGGQQ